MRIESKKYLYDIARAAKLAIEFIEGKTFADYSANVMLRSAVERQLETVVVLRLVRLIPVVLLLALHADEPCPSAEWERGGDSGGR